MSFNPSIPAQQYLTFLGVSGQHSTVHVLVIIDLRLHGKHSPARSLRKQLVTCRSHIVCFILLSSDADGVPCAPWSPKSEADARTIASEIITANDIWEFRSEPLNLQHTHFDNCQARAVLFQSSVYILRRPQNLNEVKPV